MSAKVCLRCDWTGETGDASCARCGATLFASTRVAAPTDDTGGDRPAVAVRESGRTWPARVAVAAVAVFAVAAFAFVQLHPGPATGVPSVAGTDGYLLVPAAGPNGVRLWIWDLAEGTAVPGPVLGATPETMVESVTLQDTWIGFTTRTRGGARTASVVRELGPTNRPIVVARGRLVAWSPDAGYVSVARWRPLGGCRYDLVVRTSFVTLGSLERGFSRPVCGEPVAFGRYRDAPYIALEHGGSLRIAQVGNDYLSTRLHGRTILSVSIDNDLLVQRPHGPLELWFLPSAPIRVGSTRRGLLPDDVLTWSLDASEAYVLGTEHGLHGVYQLTVGPQPRPREPVLVTATSAVDVAATTAGNGDLYLATDGVVRRWHDGSLTDVPAPAGAPAPGGPILWVSTLPYSSPGG